MARTQNIKELITPITITDTEATIFSECVEGIKSVALALDLDINSSTGVELIAYGLMEEGGTEFNIPIKAVTATSVSLQDGKYVLPDADNKYVIGIDVNNNFKFLVVKVKATSVGGTPAQILELWRSLNQYGV